MSYKFVGLWVGMNKSYFFSVQLGFVLFQIRRMVQKSDPGDFEAGIAQFSSTYSLKT